jgi:hypothetical protein
VISPVCLTGICLHLPGNTNADPVTVSIIPVLSNYDGYREILYRYQLMFLYGSTCSLVDYTK